MDKVYVVYWSQTGNTETMAQAVGKGAEAAGKEASVVAVSDITADVLKDLPGFALGCPAMGAEELDDSEMDPFVTEVEAFTKGRRSHFSAPMAGATANGCEPGQSGCRTPVRRS